MKKFNIISCFNNNRVIGNNNDLIYKIKEDLQRFKSLTENNVVIMGRKTFESLPKKPLPNRINIVITRDKEFNYDGVIVVNSFEEMIDLCYSKYIDKEWFIIGGGQIYEESIKRNIVSRMFITLVDDDLDGDVKFPSINYDEWLILHDGNQFSGKYNFHFVTYLKN